MYADPLQINDGAAVIDYAKARILGNQSQFVSLTENTEAAKVTLRVLHSRTRPKKAPANYAIDRHIFTVTRDEYKGDTSGFHEVATVNLSIALPNTDSISRTELDKMINTVKNFLTTANVDKLLRGEL